MRNDSNHPDSAPSPEQLAAFLDGELDPAARLRVEAWLTTDPAVAAEIDGQRRVAQLWAATAPPDPNAAAWTATLTHIEAKLAPTPSRRRRGLPRTLWLGAGAAAVLAVALLGRVFFHPGEPGTSAPRSIVDAAPAEPEILLASQDDVSIMSIEPFSQDDGLVAAIGEGEVPMIVAPRFAHAGNREP